MTFLIVDGDILKKEEADLSYLFWGEPFMISQDIWFGFGGIPLFHENIDALCSQLDVLNIKIPEFLNNRRELYRLSKRMLNKNRYYMSGLLHIQLFVRNTDVNYTISASAFKGSGFPYTENGLLVNVVKSQKLPGNLFYPNQFYNRATWEIFRSRLRNSKFQGSILLNEDHMVCEGIASNLFMIKDDVLITPAIESGCFEDTIRKPLLDVATQLNIKSMELTNIKKDMIPEMKELFFASEKNGIQWILGVENKRFFPNISKRIHESLNKYLKEKVS